MPPRTLLSSEQRVRLFSIQTDPAEMTRHYVLGADDLALVGARRRASNRLGFAVQLCALRHPGGVLDPLELSFSKVHFSSLPKSSSTVRRGRDQAGGCACPADGGLFLFEGPVVTEPKVRFSRSPRLGGLLCPASTTAELRGAAAWTTGPIAANQQTPSTTGLRRGPRCRKLRSANRPAGDAQPGRSQRLRTAAAPPR